MKRAVTAWESLTQMDPILNVNNIEVIYDDVILVLKGMSLSIDEGQIVCLLGANGAGKTTTLKAISGLLKTEEGEVTDGAIEFMGKAHRRHGTGKNRPHGRVPGYGGDAGCSMNSRLKKTWWRPVTLRSQKPECAKTWNWLVSYFPRLKERWRGLAGYLSGGEQQMLVIGRALMARPKLMMLDEPSLGLSPLLVSEIFRDHPAHQ